MLNKDDGFEALSLLIHGFQVSRLLRLVADLGIADRIAPDGSRRLDELANECDVLQEQLLRVLRVLAAFGVFSLRADGSVAHSPRSLHLRKAAPNSLHHAARFWTATGSWKAWSRVDEAMTGGNPHEAAWGMSRFEYLRCRPEEARVFDAFMAHFPDGRHEAIATSYDFSRASLIVDLGGGNGETLRRILHRFPKARGLVFDREDVVEAIPTEARLGGRIAVQGGSFFKQVPDGGDIYLLVRVLHDWADNDCLRILRACRAAMPSDARLLIIERMLEPDPAQGDPMEYLIDVQMMAMFGNARERTRAEFDALLEASGFHVARLVTTPSAVSILEAALR
jgi:hypothetical protein